MAPQMRGTVIGCGSWGTALALILARNDRDITLAGRESEELIQLQSRRENLIYLPGHILPKSVQAIEITGQLEPTDFFVIAVPSSVVGHICQFIPPGSNIVIASKGLDQSSHRVLSEVVAERLPDSKIAALSGPNLAVEIARGTPCATVVASDDTVFAQSIQGAFNSRSFRVYTSADLLGVQLAGALKNVYAIAAGMSDGLGFGDNSKAALMTRGLREMANIGVHLGAKLETFMGLAGMGDLIATSISSLSRNYRLGVALAQRTSLEEALQDLGQVAEGVPTTHAVCQISRLKNIEAHLAAGVETVLKGHSTPIDVLERLMTRDPGAEIICP